MVPSSQQLQFFNTDQAKEATMNGGAMTESEYLAALAEIETLMLATLDTDDGQRLDALVCLVQTYEAKHWPL